MSTWGAAAGWLRRKAGRVLAGTVGTFLLAHGLFVATPEAVRIAIFVGGLFLFAAATLLPLIKRLRVGGQEIETREEAEESLQLGAEIEQIRDDRPAPEEIDLPGTSWWDGARYLLGDVVIEWLLSKLPADLAGCEARIFLYDATEQRLMPAYRPPSAVGPPLGFAVGQGVVGTAYQTKDYAYATGASTHDGTFRLDERMQARYRDLAAVAAVPIFGRDGDVLGALALSSRNKATRLTTESGIQEHLALAQKVSVCLVDLLRVTG